MLIFPQCKKIVNFHKKKKAKSKERCVIHAESTESTESDMLQLDVCIKDSKL